MGQNQPPFQGVGNTNRDGMRHSTAYFMPYAYVFIRALKC